MCSLFLLLLEGIVSFIHEASKLLILGTNGFGSSQAGFPHTVFAKLFDPAEGLWFPLDNIIPSCH